MNINDVLQSGRNTLSLTEVASIMECDPRTISRAVANGHIQAINLGRIKRIPTAPLLKQLGVEAKGGQK